MPPSVFFKPLNFLTVIIAYGLPVLVVREAALRWRLGLFGMFMMGLAYGIYNEGICAKTLLMNVNMPAPSFNGYVWLTINWAWAILILVWHALHSIVYPIILVSYFFPESRDARWLSNAQRNIAIGVFSVTGIMMFFAVPPSREAAAPVYLPVFVSVITLFVLLARRLPQGIRITSKRQSVSWLPALAGFAFYILYLIGLTLFGTAKAPTGILLVYALAVLTGAYRFLKWKGWLSLPALAVFVLGDYIGVGFIPLFRAFKTGSLEVLIANPLILVVLVALCAFIVRKNGVRGIRT